LNLQRIAAIESLFLGRWAVGFTAVFVVFVVLCGCLEQAVVTQDRLDDATDGIDLRLTLALPCRAPRPVPPWCAWNITFDFSA
jgi:hypothetical protein